MNNMYYDQVKLLIRALPVVMKEEDFALKGGTAINLFVRDMPRLSVDIDLTFLPLMERSATINEINTKMQDTARRLEKQITGAQTRLIYTKEKVCRNIQLFQGGSVIKIEINHILRGQVQSSALLPLCEKAQEEFGAFVEAKCLSFSDLYAGKLCASLSRQHPRDLFDVKLLIENEGVSNDLRKTFIIYMCSGNGSISSMLNPRFKDVRLEFGKEFSGMSFVPVDYEDLENARKELVQAIRLGLTNDEKEFLMSFKSGEPKWDLLGLPDIEVLPGLRWKLQNIKSLELEQRKALMKRLEDSLNI